MCIVGYIGLAKAPIRNSPRSLLLLRVLFCSASSPSSLHNHLLASVFGRFSRHLVFLFLATSVAMAGLFKNVFSGPESSGAAKVDDGKLSQLTRSFLLRLRLLESIV